MKRHMLALILCAAAGYAGYACAEEESLTPIVVEHVNGGRIVVNCAPPNDSAICADFHALIRQNFSPQEIGMLFGPATAYLQYPTGYERARARYVAFLRDIDENGMPPPVAMVLR